MGGERGSSFSGLLAGRTMMWKQESRQRNRVEWSQPVSDRDADPNLGKTHPPGIGRAEHGAKAAGDVQTGDQHPACPDPGICSRLFHGVQRVPAGGDNEHDFRLQPFDQTALTVRILGVEWVAPGAIDQGQSANRPSGDGGPQLMMIIRRKRSVLSRRVNAASCS